MAKDNFQACLSETLTHEGGWSDHPADPGGATMKGVTIGRYREHYPSATKSDLRNISDADIQRIYRDDYWRPVRGDDLPRGVDLSVFDFGVNSGPSRSVRYVQAVVGVKQDGKMGPETLMAITLSNYPATIKTLCARRLGFVKSLAIWNTFGKGWSRRIASVEARSLSWVLSKRQLEAEAKAARDKAAAQRGGAVVTTGGGATEIVQQGTTLPWWVIMIAVALIAAPFVIRAIINRQRAAALAKAAKEA